MAQCNLAWDSLGGGVTSSVANVFAVGTLGGGQLLAGGQFSAVGGTPAARIAKWDGSAWSAVGGGLEPFNAVYAVCQRPNGELIAGGQELAFPGPIVYANIARWDGVAWSPLGAGVAGSVYALASLANGDLAVGGSIGFAAGQAVHGVARWNGVAWSPIGAGFDGLGPFTSVHALATLPNGDLIAGGNFTMSGSDTVLRVARWDGTHWSQVGAGFNGPVTSLLALPNGDVVAGGTFTTSGGVAVSRVARFDGTAWQPLGAGLDGNPNVATVDALARLPNGDLVAGGLFQVNGAPLGGLARWNGVAWSPLGGGPDGYVAALAFQPTGTLVAGGSFIGAAGRGVSRLSTPCPAAVSNAPSGCLASAGHLEVAADAWVGSTWRAVADGLPPGALVFSVLGLSPTALPLSAVFSTAGPGCVLLVAPDDVTLRLTGGTLEVELAIPPSPALAGSAFHHQLASLAFNASMTVAATNALTMTIGAF